MLNLISIGGQHQGVFGMPKCIYSSVKFCEYLRLVLNKEAYARWNKNYSSESVLYSTFSFVINYKR